MENTVASGAKMHQSWPSQSEAAAPISYYSTDPHQAYVYSDSNYSFSYLQPQIPNPNLHHQQPYSTNGINSVIHPPGVDPNPATLDSNFSYVHDAHQLVLAHAAYSQGAVSVPLAEAVAIAYHQDNNFTDMQLNPYINGVTIQPTVAETFITAANKKSTFNFPKKVKVVQSAWCEVCKIDCNNKNVLDAHKLGRKHKWNLEKLLTPGIRVNVPAPASTVIGPPENPSRKKAKRTTGGKEDLETKKKKVLEGGAAAQAVRTCHICKVVCNSEVVFKYHLAGQKHVSMMTTKYAST